MKIKQYTMKVKAMQYNPLNPRPNWLIPTDVTNNTNCIECKLPKENHVFFRNHFYDCKSFVCPMNYIVFSEGLPKIVYTDKEFKKKFKEI